MEKEDIIKTLNLHHYHYQDNVSQIEIELSNQLNFYLNFSDSKLVSYCDELRKDKFQLWKEKHGLVFIKKNDFKKMVTMSALNFIILIFFALVLYLTTKDENNFIMPIIIFMLLIVPAINIVIDTLFQYIKIRRLKKRLLH